MLSRLSYLIIFTTISITSANAARVAEFTNGELYNINDDTTEWTISELSGSWRIINPFEGIALRADGNNVSKGEVNGSDEAQLWKISPAGDDTYHIYPANNPTLAWDLLCHEARRQKSRYTGRIYRDLIKMPRIDSVVCQTRRNVSGAAVILRITP